MRGRPSRPQRRGRGFHDRDTNGNLTPASSCSSLNSQDTGDVDEESDAETSEFAQLRCSGERTEVVAERHRRRNRCADYPGLAFTTSVFSSNTLMKFSVIKNELHNIMSVQLKRAEGEVCALGRRIQLLEEDLERSEERLTSATSRLSEVSQSADESERMRKALESRTNNDEDRVTILEQQLCQAKLIAEEADKKYEEVARKVVMLENDLERSDERAENGESKVFELESELQVIGNNLKSLEVSEEKATVREDEFERMLRESEERLKQADARAEFAERSVQKLQKELDRLEDTLADCRQQQKMLQDEMDSTLNDIQNL